MTSSTRCGTKTEVPDGLKRVLQEASEHGVTVRRFHTDNEYVCNTPEVREACETACQPWGVLFTTSNAYDSSTDSKIERHWRRLGDDGRPGFLQSMLADQWYICCLIDASAKHKELPRTGTDTSPRMLFTGKKGKALPFKPFGTLAYVMLVHELNDITTSFAKPHARARAAICLSFHVTGEITDTHQPGWVLFVPDYHRNKPIISRHCTFSCGAYPGQPWIEAGLEGFLRINTPGDVETMELDHDGNASVKGEGIIELPKAHLAEDINLPGLPTPVTHVRGAGDAREPVGTASSPTIAQRRDRCAGLQNHPHANTSHQRTPANPSFDVSALDIVDVVVNRAILPSSSFSSCEHRHVSKRPRHNHPSRG